MKFRPIIAKKCFLLFLIFNQSFSFEYENWTKVYSDSNFRIIKDIDILDTTGYIVAGNQYFYDENKTAIFINKISNSGSDVWLNVFSEAQNQSIEQIKKYGDDYICVGSTDLDGTLDPSTNNLDHDLLVLKIDSMGNVIFSRQFGTEGVYDSGFGFILDDSGNIIIAGTKNRKGWVLKLNNYGEIIWSKDNFDKGYFKTINKTNDGGYIVGGSDDYSIQSWFVKLDSLGNEEFNTSPILSGIRWTPGKGIFELDDSGFVFAGAERNQFKIVKIDNVGNLVWVKTLGNYHTTGLQDLKLLSDNNLLLTGTTIIPGEGHEFTIIRTTNEGELIWEKKFGYGIGFVGKEIDVNNLIVGGYVFLPNINIDNAILIQFNDKNLLPQLITIGATVNKSPAFKWIGLVDADTYKIEIDSTPNFKAPIFDTVLTNTFFVPEFELNIGTYYWRVSSNLDTSLFTPPQMMGIISSGSNLFPIKGNHNNNLIIFPNPFSSSLNIHQAKNYFKRIFIYNVNGRLIRKLNPIKNKMLAWDGKDNQGKLLPAGLYTISFIDDKKVINRKVLLKR